LIPNQYQAVSTVLLKPSAVADPPKPQWQMSCPHGESNARRRHLRISIPRPGLRLTPQRFMGERLSVTPLRDSSLLQIVVTLEDPQVAASAANAVAERAVVHNHEINSAALDFIKGRRDEADRQLQADDTRLLASRRANQLELLRKDGDINLGKSAELRKLMVEVERERVRVSRLERELAQQTRVVAGRLDAARALLQAPESGNDTKSLDLSSSALNQVYVQALGYQLTLARLNLAALEATATRLTSTLELDGANLEQLNRLYSADIEQQRLQGERDLSGECTARSV
jgi:hypothetical protein